MLATILLAASCALSFQDSHEANCRCHPVDKAAAELSSWAESWKATFPIPGFNAPTVWSGTNFAPPQFSKELEERLKKMFAEQQGSMLEKMWSEALKNLPPQAAPQPMLPSPYEILVPRPTDSPQDQEAPEKPEPTITINWDQTFPQQIQLQDPSAPTVLQTLDIDEDGLADLSVQQTNGRGPLSTYYASYQIVVLHETRLLNGGSPMAPGTAVTLRDLMYGTLSVNLCSVGGSLRYPDESYESFSGGLWWGKDRQGLGVALMRDGKMTIGYVLMSVSKLGKIDIHRTRLQEVTLPSIVVEDD